jgi:epoxyqueuosine reductase
MELLLHCCCGPCAAGSLPQFIEQGYQPFCYFNNPNIHPYQEQQMRRQAFRSLMEHEALPYVITDGYPLEDWLARVAFDPMSRCAYCYERRLTAVAAEAVSRGIKRFSTTLLISPYQNHDLIRETGEWIAAKQGLEFIYLDLRPGFRAGQQKARDMGLYMQKYCGCIYSEKERFLPD